MRNLLLALACIGAGASQAASAQGSAQGSEQGGAATANAAIDAQAMAAMDRMSAALRSIANFSVKTDATTEVVLEDGQKIQFGARVDLKVRRPNAFRVSTEADTQSREMFYDGKNFTVYAPRLGYYASFAAPPSIGQTLEVARTKYGLEVPLADLFEWGTDQTIRSRIQEAMVIRPERIDKRTCMHYAFRQEKVDWQVWVEEGAQPLPCKLVITSRDDASMPQYTAVLHWDLTTPVEASALAFTPPADARKIPITEVAAQQGGAQ
ncbi:DUF2092 domain-containing protein [Sphingomonas sp. C3-2]|uniref:DUF2092 domain-containing protein n=1 Tax=Sphingomonas sp. C3-2 TaxID=3062169 RepID=UPI00398205C2